MAENKFHRVKKTDIFFQILLILGLCGYFGGMFVWLGRAFVLGGGAEKAFATVIVPLLIVILLLTTSTLFVIAREGNKAAKK